MVMRWALTGETAMASPHAVAFHALVPITAGGLAGAAGAALTVIAAGAAQQGGESKAALLQRNVRDCTLLFPQCCMPIRMACCLGKTCL